MAKPTRRNYIGALVTETEKHKYEALADEYQKSLADLIRYALEKLAEKD